MGSSGGAGAGGSPEVGSGDAALRTARESPLLSCAESPVPGYVHHSGVQKGKSTEPGR